MSYKYIFLVCTGVILGTVDCASVASACKKGDWNCLENSLNAILPTILGGIPNIGIESSEPIHVDVIRGDLPTVKYVVSDAVTSGFTRCTLKNVRGDLTTLTFSTELICPSINITSKYDMHGKVVDQPIEGTGDFAFTSSGYHSTVEGDLEKIQDNGKDYVAIKSVKAKHEPVVPVTFKFSNLFNGNQELSDAVHKYFNTNWKQAAEFIQDPVWEANLKVVIKNINKYLRTVPVEEIMSN